MTKKSMGEWSTELIQENKNKTIKIGDVVEDYFGDKGVVVKIRYGTTPQDHGTIYVWQQDKLNYGADNCEHYSFFGWKEALKIISD